VAVSQQQQQQRCRLLLLLLLLLFTVASSACCCWPPLGQGCCHHTLRLLLPPLLFWFRVGCAWIFSPSNTGTLLHQRGAGQGPQGMLLLVTTERSADDVVFCSPIAHEPSSDPPLACLPVRKKKEVTWSELSSNYVADDDQNEKNR